MHRGIPLLAACLSFACIGASADTPAAEDDKNRATEVDCVVTPDEPDCDDGDDEYWTPERMRNAKPLPTPVLDPETMKPVESEDTE